MSIATFLVAVLLSDTGLAPSADRGRATANAALAAAPIVDGHNDLAWALRELNRSRVSDFNFYKLPEALRGKIVTDYTMLKAGGVGGQFWSVYVPAETEGPEAVRQTLEQIDLMQRLIDANPSMLVRVDTADALKRSMGTDRIGSLFGVEGGHSIGNSLGVLRQFYSLGVRYMTLTHSKTTAWADSATDAVRHDGLAPFGEAVVREMNRLGMLVDLSHVSDAVMRDVLDVSLAPVIFSHSSARALVGKPRNVPDDVLARLKDNGGVIMVLFAENALSTDVDDWNREQAAEKARLAYDHPGDSTKVDEGIRSWRQSHPSPRATIAHLADHIDHIRRVAGIDAIGIGSDFDGLPSYPEGLDTTAHFRGLFLELATRGYTRTDLEKISSGNILRVMKRAEEIAAALRQKSGPGEEVFSPNPQALGR